MEEKNKSTFEELYELDVKDKVEQKNGLNYLSWAYAWAEVKKIDENAQYHIHKFGEMNLPYVYDSKTGYMVFTDMTIRNITHEMFLPVMDGANKTMLDHPYNYKVKEYVEGKPTGNYIEKNVEEASMFDINKTLMRCLVKNIAMFGLGLKLYQGEDLPLVETKEDAEKYKITFGKYQGKTMKEVLNENPKYFDWLVKNSTDANVLKSIELLTGKVKPVDEIEVARADLYNKMEQLELETNTNHDDLLGHYMVESNSEMTVEQLKDAIEVLEKKKGLQK